jgi:hypothetical protein
VRETLDELTEDVPFTQENDLGASNRQPCCIGFSLELGGDKPECLLPGLASLRSPVSAMDRLGIAMDVTLVSCKVSGLPRNPELPR